MNLPLILVLLSAASDGGTAAVSLHGPLPAVYVAPAELVVARCDEGRCPPSGADVCDPASPDPDRHVLRALELATGNEAWSDERFPTPVGSLNQGGRVIALVAMNMTLTGAVVRDARTGAELATCSVAAEPAGFSGACADKGALLVSGFNLGMSGIPRPRHTLIGLQVPEADRSCKFGPVLSQCGDFRARVARRANACATTARGQDAAAARLRAVAAELRWLR